MRCVKLMAASLLALTLWLPAPAGEAAGSDDDGMVYVVKGDDELRKSSVREEQKLAKSRADNDRSRADEWIDPVEEDLTAEERKQEEKKAASARSAAEESRKAEYEPKAGLDKKEAKEKKDGQERYVRVADEAGFVYYLDTQTAKWRYLPYSASEKILDVWVKLIHEGVDDYDSDDDYSYPQTYFMEHYYLRPDKQQIQFLCELEVTGRPQNAIRERDYSPANWEGLVPGSIEDEIYHGALKIVKKRKGMGMTRHGQNITMRDAVEEYLRISL